ncbi:MAG: polysaccharide biosynthesis C-terminal domain-containing protein [Clostridiales bacterium]|nr:polysaccharide biosynthesis C-terminal domain-containing protein [Clostridiales bacterium]
MGNSNKGKHLYLIKDTFIFSIGKIGSRAVLFFLVPLYTNFLTKSQYGTADLVFTISQLLASVFGVVIFDSVTRYGLMKGVKRENVIANSFIVLAFSSVLSLIALPVFSVFKSIGEWKYYLSGLIILIVAMDIEMNYLRVIDKKIAYSIISIIQAVVLAGGNILFIVRLGWGINGYLLSTCASYLCCVIMAFVAGNILSDLKKAEFDKVLLRQMLLFSIPLILNNISWWVIQSSDKLMIEYMMNSDSLGVYTAATRIPSLIYVAVSIFQQAWGISSIKEIESTDDTSFYSEVLKVYSAGVFFCCVLLVAITKPFMNIYVGKEFSEAWRYVPLLVASAGFSAISAYYGSLYGALKKSVNNMLTTVFAAIVNIIVNVVFIALVGIWGAIIGTIVSYVLISFVRMIDVSRFIQMDVDVPVLVVNTIIVLVQAVLVSINYYPYICSVVAIVLFVAFNMKSLINMASRLIRKTTGIK